MSYSVKPCKSEETLKGYWGQLVGVRAARMQINCRLSLLLLCVYVCLCVCVCIATHTHIYIRKRSLFVLWHIFFLAAVFIHPTANHLSFFILLTWILFLFRNREKKTEHLCFFPICYTSVRFVAGLPSSVCNPRTQFIFLLKMSTIAVASAHALEGVSFFFSLSLSLHYCIERTL